MIEDQLYDVTIVGGGPAGLYGAFYSGLREMKTKLIEFQPYLGGKVHMYPEKMIWDVGGMRPVSGELLIDQMKEQALTFEPDIVLGEKVTSISKNDDGQFVLHTSSGQTHYSKTVILAVGYGIFQPTKLQIEGAERFEVSNLHYTVKSLARFKDKVVLISGGGNSAIDWAIELESIAKKVYLTYRKDMLNGHESQVTWLRESSVECLLNVTIQRLVASADHELISKVVLRSHDNDAETELEVDEVIISHGYERDRNLLDNSAMRIEIDENRGIKGTPMSETSVEGLYAAGDILHHEGKLHLIAGAFQDAANAVNRAKQYITPEAWAWGSVSSHNDLFAQKNRELLKHLYAK
ncbi:thioredoxin reductase (NADPH) [Paenibacillus endophyticus]|uniref:Ferredoxin--NADP reductase n=1 Tax=Paenibacillus endophyticus TaxID=1294268 RepID=A0A7W5GBH7_9BACL|nr:NAD(P)/FAD-dependent oxidoreductase [Paenibacillus endophyticus]MBB3153806.1 thioredoxin reductase (NADPH) [Paenibacillus endophyticus]